MELFDTDRSTLNLTVPASLLPFDPDVLTVELWNRVNLDRHSGPRPVTPGSVVVGTEVPDTVHS